MWHLHTIDIVFIFFFYWGILQKVKKKHENNCIDFDGTKHKMKHIFQGVIYFKKNVPKIREDFYFVFLMLFHLKNDSITVSINLQLWNPTLVINTVH